MARRILLADDSVTAQNMGRKILTEAGYEVITVNNGSAALKRIAEQKPDIIVLDVYMPGYGGLEVCHRLKDNPETSRIPVLLTVGKLEPFKVEESRRVRADMHIVKPFDTSELLTAIAKLEDRIVAQAEMPKKGRFAKSGAEDVPPADSYGDQNSGWKSRLIAPRKKPKAEKPETKAESREEIKGIARPEQSSASNANESFEEETVNTKDWRALLSAREAEEIAAAERAKRESEETREELEETRKPKGKKPARQNQEEENHERENLERQDQEQEKDLSIVAHERIAAPGESAAQIVARAEAAVKAEDAHQQKPEIRETEQVAATSESAKPDLKPTPGEGAGHERDVADALASLVPATNATASETVNGLDFVAAGNHMERSSGPRWVAQAVLVSQEESASLLEQEMEQAFKQFAAAEPPATFVMGPLEAMSFNVPGDSDEKNVPQRQHLQSVAALEPATPVPPASPLVTVAAAETESVTTDTLTSAKLEVEEAKDSDSESQVSAPASTMGALWMSTPAAYVAATAGVTPEEKQAEPHSDREAPPSQPIATEAAFAAAAGASVAASVATEESPAKIDSTHKESELAAAWQSWRQVRESDPQPASDAAPEPRVQTESSTEDEGHGEEISSLVDTMLAELKPKLMKEIAKKMGKGKDREKS